MYKNIKKTNKNKEGFILCPDCSTAHPSLIDSDGKETRLRCNKCNTYFIISVAQGGFL